MASSHSTLTAWLAGAGLAATRSQAVFLKLVEIGPRNPLPQAVFLKLVEIAPRDPLPPGCVSQIRLAN